MASPMPDLDLSALSITPDPLYGEEVQTLSAAISRGPLPGSVAERELVLKLMRARQEIQIHTLGLTEREVLRRAEADGIVQGALDSPTAYGD